MTQLAVGYRTTVQSGREQRTSGLMKHLGVADVTTLRAGGDLTGTMLTGHGIEVCMVPGPPLTGIIQALDRDAAAGSRYLDLIIGARNINLSAQQGGRITLPGSTASDCWVTNADGNNVTLGVTAWTAYDVPGMTPLSFTLPAAARTRVDFMCNYQPPTGVGTTYFHANIDGSNELDTPDVCWVSGYAQTVVGFAIFFGTPAGAHTAKLGFTPTNTGTFTRNAWYTRVMVTASYV